MPKHDHLHTLPINERYEEPLWAAMNFAAKAHENQLRKAEKQPYIVHPFDVMERVRAVTDDPDTQIAAVLHDTVEDTPVTFEELETEFGSNVAFLVWGVSKNDDIENWHDRNTAYLTRLEFEAGDGSVIIALADKVSNLTDMIRNHQKYGSEFWQHFNLQPLEQLWWYTSVLQVAKKRVPECPLNAELEALIEEFCIEVVGDIAQKRAAASAL